MSQTDDDLALFDDLLRPEPQPRTCGNPAGHCKATDHFHPTMNTQLPRSAYKAWANGYMDVHTAAKETVEDALSGH